VAIRRPSSSFCVPVVDYFDCGRNECSYRYNTRHRKEPKMNKHLNWPEDDRICHLPDPLNNDLCPGCCNSLNPKHYMGANWECIFKAEHEGNHADVWMFEWNDNGTIISRPKYNGRCYSCGNNTPFDGMLYCGKACASLDLLESDEQAQFQLLADAAGDEDPHYVAAARPPGLVAGKPRRFLARDVVDE
jgi:hypothetical protein